jgi:hypothetical protein
LPRLAYRIEANGRGHRIVLYGVQHEIIELPVQDGTIGADPYIDGEQLESALARLRKNPCAGCLETAQVIRPSSVSWLRQAVTSSRGRAGSS